MLANWWFHADSGKCEFIKQADFTSHQGYQWFSSLGKTNIPGWLFNKNYHGHINSAFFTMVANKLIPHLPPNVLLLQVTHLITCIKTDNPPKPYTLKWNMTASICNQVINCSQTMHKINLHNVIFLLSPWRKFWGLKYFFSGHGHTVISVHIWVA